jgi:hypothetical protein
VGQTIPPAGINAQATVPNQQEAWSHNCGGGAIQLNMSSVGLYLISVTQSSSENFPSGGYCFWEKDWDDVVIDQGSSFIFNCRSTDGSHGICRVGHRDIGYYPFTVTVKSLN